MTNPISRKYPRPLGSPTERASLTLSCMNGLPLGPCRYYPSLEEDGGVNIHTSNTIREASGKANGVSFRKTGDTVPDEKFLQPLAYLLQTPGKGFRVKLVQALNYWLKVPADQLSVLQDMFKIIHNWGLLIDDIEDNSLLRGGIPAAHSIYGLANTISASNYEFFKSLKSVLSLQHSEAMKIYIELLLDATRGQALDIYWRENCICPLVEEYQEMVKGKTGAAFMFGMRMMQLYSDNKTDFTKLGDVLGLYFQIRDDYCNLCLEQYSQDKGYCEDLTEGKFSFPIIHAIQSHPDDNQVINIIRQRTRDVEVKKQCVALLEKFGSFSYTRKILEELDAEARAEVAKLGGNPLLEAILDEALNWKRKTE